MSSERCVAVIGTGSVGLRHLDVLRRVDRVKPVPVPVHAHRRDALRNAGFQVARDLEEAVSFGATACIVATDTGRHQQDAVLAINLGLDILVEKPMASDSLQASNIKACAEERKRKVFVGCVLRFSESLNVFREHLPQIGHVHAVAIECRSYLPDWRSERRYQDSYSARDAEGGVLRDLVHDIDYAGWLFGWPSAVQARIQNFGRLGVQAEETAELNWKTSSGYTVSVNLDYLTRFARRNIQAFGALGTLVWDGVEQTVSLDVIGSSRKIIRSVQTRNEMFMSQDVAFLRTDCGETDLRLASGGDGVKALAICDAARRAASHRKEQIVEW
jgi:predicted dehydrogenase